MSILVKYLAVMCIVILAINSANSLKCYMCSSNSLTDCEKNQTVQNCPNNIPCGTLKLVLDNKLAPGVVTNLYIKTCVALANCTQYFNSTGKILFLKSCEMITRCNTDYCNGEPPTTLPVTSGSVTKGSTEGGTKPRPKSGSEKICNVLPLYFVAVLFIWAVCR